MQEFESIQKKEKKVCMFVYNSCIHDARVIKEATTLGKSGYNVKIIAIVSNDVHDLIEEKENFTVYRVEPRSVRFYLDLLVLKLNIKKPRTEIHPAPTGSPACQSGEERFPAPIGSNHEATGVNPWYGVHQSSPSLIKLLLRAVKRKLSGVFQITTYISYWLKAKRLAIDFKADIYHAHDLTALLPAYLAAKKTEAKVIYDSHELFTEHNTLLKKTAFSKWAIKKFEAFLICRVNAVITVNQSIAIELSKLYDIPIPFTVMNCPAYQESIRNNLLREKLQLNGELKIILYLGAITFNRGLEESITAMRKVNGGVLVIMGYGKTEYISSLKEMALKLGMENKVFFIPPVPHQEVVKYAASADIGFVPIQNACKSYYYCSPNKLFESMMAGLPVAASDLPELRRVVEETNCGLLFDPSDPDDIANVLNTMISDCKLIEQMRHSALKHAHKYSWEEEAKKLLSIYAGLFEDIRSC